MNAIVPTRQNQIDLNDRQTIVTFGTSAVKDLSTISEKMLVDVKNKDLGAVAAPMADMITQMRGLDFSGLEGGNKLGWFGKIIGKVTPVAKFIAQYEDVLTHIEKAVTELERTRIELLKDVGMLDHMYETTLKYFHDLEDYIASGELVLKQIDEEIIPKMKEETDTLASQRLSDTVNKRNLLDRKIHDLKINKTIQMQALPSIRIVQQNDTDLIEKIQSHIDNSIPAWKQQLALAVTMARSGDAAELSRSVSDFQDQIIVANAKQLRQTNAAVRTEIERSTTSIEAIQAANAEIIGALQDSISIAATGTQNRIAAEKILLECQTAIKDTLRSAA